MSLAPVALFVYNRPEHTRLTVNALAENIHATETELFVFSDAARDADTESAVAEVRAYIRTIRGFRSVHVVEREHNFGLARSIIDGVGLLCRRFGKVIVLEDDIVTTRHFLSFMNDGLEKYEDEEKVMHVSGYMFPVVHPEKLPETFFYRVTTCWGWATWQRAWQHFQPDAGKLLETIDVTDRQRQFDVDGTAYYVDMLTRQLAGKLDSWAVRWYASVFLRGGQCLHPRYSLVNNIGLDGSGVHCDLNEDYTVQLHDIPVKIELNKHVSENALALAAIRQFNRSLVPSWPRRLVRVLGRYWKQINRTKKCF